PPLTTYARSETVSSTFGGGGSLRFLLGELAPTRASAVTATRTPIRRGSVRRIDLPPCAALGETLRACLEDRAGPCSSPPARPPPCGPTAAGRGDPRRRDSKISPTSGQDGFAARPGSLPTGHRTTSPAPGVPDQDHPGRSVLRTRG